MSKHPTSWLSQRDIACIEYGKALRHLRDEYEARHFTYEYEHVEELIAEARAARERIFRDCQLCAHNGKCHTLGVTVFPAACYCKNYKYEVAGRNNIVPAPASTTRKG